MLSNKSILTIDDSTTIRTFLRSLLVPQGAYVEEARSGQEALEFLAAGRHYDLILLDLLLPDLDGIEVLKRIRARESESTVVMLTAMGGVKSAMAAVRQGADAYIEKQDLYVGGDYSEFFFALEQAIEHRAGIVAKAQLERVKADFYSMVTHDLRGPAGTTLVSIDLVLEEEPDTLTPSQREFLGIAREATERLQGLIDDYLDYAKIDAGYLKLDRNEIDLRQVVEGSIRVAALQARARKQTLTVDLSPDRLPAVVDANKLKQVLDNLLSNAIKYTPEGGCISVGLQAEGEQAVLQVQDTGNGIPARQLPVLFSKYHRVPGQATRGIRGTGLGLLIVKEIVEAHGGTVQAESEGVPGSGATFTVRLPLNHGTAPEATPVSQAITRASG